MIEKLQGAMSALITPFDEAGGVDVRALETIVDEQIARGIDGLVACGTTGETPTLSAEEQERVIKCVVERAAGRVPVIAGTGSNNTKATAAQTARARAWGADAALVVVPYYNKPSQEGMVRHFEAAHEEGGLPIIAYNVPGRTVADMMPETIARLQSDGVIAGIKDATANMIRATDTLRLLDPDRAFAMMTGDDFTILPFIACGGVGVISVVSNIAPGDTSKLVKWTSAGELSKARALHNRIVALAHAMFAAPNPVPVKAAMALAGWCRPDARLPLVTADDALRDRVRLALETYSGKAKLDGFMA